MKLLKSFTVYFVTGILLLKNLNLSVLKINNLFLLTLWGIISFCYNIWQFQGLVCN
jgi:hypothetical protein